MYARPQVFGSQLETWKKHMSFSRSSIGVYYSVLKQLIDGVNPLLNDQTFRKS